MKDKLILLTICLSLFGGTMMGQPAKPAAPATPVTPATPTTPVTPLTGLDNYKIPVNLKGAKIGKVLAVAGQKKMKVSIAKDTSGLFRISSKGVISLKKRAQLASSAPAFRYGITLKINGVTKDFELVKDEFIKNAVVAHRGAWKNFDVSQNSLSSLKNAIALGCHSSEFDVWMSQDGVPVCNHDPSIGGKVVEQTTVAELVKVPLKKNDFVPTLEQYLLTAKTQNKTLLFLEIKSSLISQERTLELTEAVVKMVHDLKAQAWVNYISFNFGSLLRVMELDPAAKTAYVSDDKTVKEVADAKMWSIDFNGKMYQADPTLIKQAHDRGLVVNVWTINDPEQMKLLLKHGVDVITTNEPEILLEILKNSAPQ